MIDTINLLWIIPLSGLAGGFVLLVLFLYNMSTRIAIQRKNNVNDNNSDERCASSEHNK